mgnify:CR=1 FL=1
MATFYILKPLPFRSNHDAIYSASVSVNRWVSPQSIFRMTGSRWLHFPLLTVRLETPLLVQRYSTSSTSRYPMVPHPWCQWAAHSLLPSVFGRDFHQSPRCGQAPNQARMVWCLKWAVKALNENVFVNEPIQIVNKRHTLQLEYGGGDD